MQGWGKKRGGRQIPWELSSLQGEFYFNQGNVVKRVEKESATEIKDEVKEGVSADLETEQQNVAAQRPSVSAIKEIRRDGRFIAYDNGTVLDTKTNLMWAAKDKGSDINWANAKSYCENYRGGGYSDWRIPSLDELAELYDKGKTQRNEYDPSYPLHLTELIDVTSFAPWASETRGSDAAFFGFNNGNRYWIGLSTGFRGGRALPVRSAK